MVGRELMHQFSVSMEPFLIYEGLSDYLIGQLFSTLVIEFSQSNMRKIIYIKILVNVWWTALIITEYLNNW